MRARYASYREHFGLTAPRTVTFWVGVVLGVLGIVLHYQLITVAALSPYSFLLLVAGFVVLVAGCLARGL